MDSVFVSVLVGLTQTQREEMNTGRFTQLYKLVSRVSKHRYCIYTPDTVTSRSTSADKTDRAIHLRTFSAHVLRVANGWMDGMSIRLPPMEGILSSDRLPAWLHQFLLKGTRVDWPMEAP
ncbi:uncharacterized protein ACBT44_012137 [Syngnathus typhle]